MKKTLPPSTIPLQHYNYHTIMSPSSAGSANGGDSTKQNTANYYDNQCISLFGDPVQPPPHEQFIANLDKNLYRRFRRDSYSSSLMEDFPKPDIFVQIKDERQSVRSTVFRNIPLNFQPSEDENLNTISGSQRLMAGPHLGPDIRVLPETDSSSDNTRTIQNSPAEQQRIGSSISSVRNIPNIINDSINNRNNGENGKRKLLSEYSEDFQGVYEKFRESEETTSQPKRIFSSEPVRYIRQMSNESYSSSEWFKPSHDYQEFTKIPKMRPSSKNVMSINQTDIQGGSPVATMLNDSSSDISDKPSAVTIDSLETQHLHNIGPSVSLSNTTNIITESIPQGLPPTGSTLFKRDPSPVIITNTICTGAEYRLNPPRPHKKSSFTIISEKSPQSSRAQSPYHQLQSEHDITKPQPKPNFDTSRMSPNLGRTYKEPPRPPPRKLSQRRRSLSSTHLKLPVIIKNGILTSDDSPRPSVQFDMSSNGRTGNNNVSTNLRIQNVPKGILQQKLTGMPSTNLTANHKIHSFETLPLIGGPIGSIPRIPSHRLNKSTADLFNESRSASAAAGKPFYATPNPTSREKGVMRVMNSADSSPSRIPIRLNWINGSLDSLVAVKKPSMSPPPRKDIFRRRSSTSPERRSSSQTEPRSSIASDRRRSSNLSSVTTSDFSYRQNSVSPMRRDSVAPMKQSLSNRRGSSVSPLRTTGRRKSIYQSAPFIPNRSKTSSSTASDSQYLKATKNYSTRKVAKPTSLSPIIGTPNKDDPLSPEELEGSAKFANPIRKSNSLTKIPVRNGSNIASHSESRSESRVQSRAESKSNSRAPSIESSRSSSPHKEYPPYSRPNSRTESRSPSRQPTRSTSRAESRSRPTSRLGSQPPSRPTSRLESRQTSRAASRAPSQASSRQDQSHGSKVQSTTSSRHSQSPPKSQRNTPRESRNSTSKSRSSSPNKGRQKSISPDKPSKMDGRSRSRGRKSSPEKETEKRSKIPSRQTSPKKPRDLNRSSPKRSSAPKESTSAKTKSGAVKKQETTFKRAQATIRKAVVLKKVTNSLQQNGPNAKKEPLKRETSSVQKPPKKLTREPSRVSLRKDNPVPLKREPSNLKKTGSSSGLTAGSKKEPSAIKLKRESSNLIKNQTENIAGGKNPDTKTTSKNIESKDVASETMITGSPKYQQHEDDHSTATGESSEKLIPMTKANVVSMTTAAIAAQPIQISTAVTNHLPVNKTNSSGQLNPGGSSSTTTTTTADEMKIPATILEKSQKTLENIQKTVTEATDEIHKTINENLTDLKILESDIGKTGMTTEQLVGTKFYKSDRITDDNLKSILENSTATLNTDEKNTKNLQGISPAPPTQPIEASVSILNGKILSENLLNPNSNNNNNNNNNTNNNNNNHNNNNKKNGESGGKMSSSVNHHKFGSEDGKHAEDMAERVSERAISVLPEVECESANLQNYDQQQQLMAGKDDGSPDDLIQPIDDHHPPKGNSGEIHDGGPDDDGKNNNLGSDSRQYLDEEEASATGCCGRSRCSKCCSRFCMPCRRCQGGSSKCCRKKSLNDIETTSVIVKEVNEKLDNKSEPATSVNSSCWKRMKCCNRNKDPKIHEEHKMEQSKLETIREEPQGPRSISAMKPKKQSKCGLCMSKIFCCRAINKVESSTEDDDGEPVRKCCFCIPCKRKKQEIPIEVAWQAPPEYSEATAPHRRESILSVPQMPPQGRCTRFMNKLKFWKKNDPSRRASTGSRKHSLAPTNPPEDPRRKLHNDLVDYNSKMKAAIPVLPIYLAYFCTGCNIIIPGLGTILSGIFCVCVGIPRFSQYDSAKARFGSFVINCIVGVSQFFCVLFCFVGWGWSIWWGSIMMKTAKKLQKVRKVEQLEREEDQRQAARAALAAAEAKAAESGPPPRA